MNIWQKVYSIFFLWNSAGNVVNIQTGQWVGKQSGLGAGMDSFYEYLLKSYILFGEKEDYRMFQAAYESIQNHMRRGWVPYRNNATVWLKWNLGGERSKWSVVGIRELHTWDMICLQSYSEGSRRSRKWNCWWCPVFHDTGYCHKMSDMWPRTALIRFSHH